jgi:hypothetical protein
LLRLGTAFDAGKVLDKIHARFKDIFRAELVKSLQRESALVIKEELRRELPLLLSPYIDAEVQYRTTGIRLSPFVLNFGISFESALSTRAKEALLNMIKAKERQPDSRFHFPFHAQNEDYVVLLEELSNNPQALAHLKDF